MSLRRAVSRGCAAALLLLAACGTPEPAEPPPPSDPELESTWRLARFALLNGQNRQAVGLYRRVQERAFARDDGVIIGDVGYEFATALLRDGQAEQAVEQAAGTRAELDRRDVPVFAELVLIEAIALNESGAAAAASAAASEALRLARPDDAETRSRANFLLGILAADAADAATAKAFLAAMDDGGIAALRADAAELGGRIHVLEDRPQDAMASFENAAGLRRDGRDYTGMARVLAAAGIAAEDAGLSAKAADFYYRAGLSATAQDDDTRAESWLRKALALSVDNGLPRIAADARARLDALGE